MNSNKIVYSLNIMDIQTVAQEELYRKLTIEEIKSVTDKIGDKINWYDAIADCINEVMAGQTHNSAKI